MMLAYLRFELRRLFRNRSLLIFTVVLPVVLYVVSTGSDTPFDRVGDLASTEYAMIALAGWGAVLGVLSVSSAVAYERASGWLRQLRSTPLPPVRVLIVKGAVSTLTAIPAVAAVGATSVVLHGLSFPAGRWLLIVLVMWLGTVPFALLGLAIGYAVRREITQPVVLLSWLTLALAGGMISSIEDFPGWLERVARLTPSYQYSEFGWRVVAGAMPTATGVGVIVAWALAFGLLARWAYRRFAALR